MCTDRALLAMRVPGKIKLIQGDRWTAVFNPLDWLPGAVNQRRAVALTAHHAAGQLLPLLRVSIGLLVQELPEPGHILMQLPHDQIAAVASQILQLWLFFRYGQ